MALLRKDKDSGRFPGSVLQGDLLTNVAAVVDSAWEPLDAEPFTVTAETGVGWSGTIQLRVSNSVSQPTVGEQGAPLGDDITSSTNLAFDVPYNWIRARVTVYSAGTLTRVSVRARLWRQ